MTDEENAQFNRMCMAILAADEMLTKLTRERDELKKELDRVTEDARKLRRAIAGLWP